jgi:hypothetical protein
MELITLTSYVAAAFFGPLYVLYRKADGFFPCLLLTLVLTGGIFGFTGLSSFLLSSRMQLMALVLGIPIALMIQSSFVVARIRRSYRRRGWLVRAV